MKKLTADLNYGFLAIIWYIIFCLPVCYRKKYKDQYYNCNDQYYNCNNAVVCRGVRLGFRHCEGEGT